MKEYFYNLSMGLLAIVITVFSFGYAVMLVISSLINLSYVQSVSIVALILIGSLLWNFSFATGDE